MKFVNAALTILLKIMFLIIFLSSVIAFSILSTYLNRSYYENYFAENFVYAQSEYIAEILHSKSESLPIEIPKEDVEYGLSRVFTKDNVRSISSTFFDTVENYEGGEVAIDLGQLRDKQKEILLELADENLGRLETCKKTDIALSGSCVKSHSEIDAMKKEAAVFLSQNADFGIPAVVEFDTEDTAADDALKTTRFLMTNRGILHLGLLLLILFPLIGIFALNSHPYYKGIRKVSTSLMQGGLFAILIKVVSVISLKLLNGNGVFEAIFADADITVTERYIDTTFNFIFGRMLEITTNLGIITLALGVVLFVTSKVIQNQNEYSY